MFKDESDSLIARPGAGETVPLEHQGGSGSDARPLMTGDIGFVGLGRMGTAMAANLGAAGFRVIAYVRNPDQMSKLVILGLKPTMGITACSTTRSSLPCCRTTTPFAMSYWDMRILASTGLQRD